MELIKWFDIYNPEHLKAYIILQETGSWPDNFIPDFVVGSYLQIIHLNAKFAQGWIKCAKSGRWPTEIVLKLC
jgi:hypothetical protein